MDKDTRRMIIGTVLVVIGLAIQQYYALQYARTATTIGQIQGWNFTKFPSGPTPCQNQSLPVNTCDSELWVLSVGMWIGGGIALVGVFIFFASLVTKVVALGGQKDKRSNLDSLGTTKGPDKTVSKPTRAPRPLVRLQPLRNQFGLDQYDYEEQRVAQMVNYTAYYLHQDALGSTDGGRWGGGPSLWLMKGQKITSPYPPNALWGA